jgi:hypothetical protein
MIRVLDFFTTPVGGAIIALISTIIGYFLSFINQSRLEAQKSRRTMKVKAWESKFETLRQFSEDLELWLYLSILQSNASDTRETIERGMETGKSLRNKELLELTKKLIVKKTYIIEYPNIFNQYEKIADIVEWTSTSPLHLELEDITSIKSLLRTIQNELQKEMVKFN